MNKPSVRWGLALWCAAVAILFVLLFFHDNKYHTPPPYGKSGVFALTETDLDRKTPLYLIDGWLLSDSRTTDQPTWIGEFANLRRRDPNTPPHGKAIYRLSLRYSGAPTRVSLHFPALSTDFVISLNGRVQSRGAGNAQIDFQLLPGDQLLTVETTSAVGYYSGIYYPPALGLPQTVNGLENLRLFFYALAFLVPLALAVFTLCLWNRREDPAAFWFGLLCSFFACYIAWFFVELFQLPFWRYWFLVEEAALCGLCCAVVRLTALAADAAQGKAFQAIRRLLVFWPAVLLTLSLLIPVWPYASLLHGICKNGYFLFVFGCIVFMAVQYRTKRETEYAYILAGDVVFGGGLLLNLFSSNQFEPVRFYWQFEWCGLFLVALFGAMMAARNRRILAENQKLTVHLEQLVEERTAQMNLLLQERKAFFSEMAHDLKAPVFATKGFIEAIRNNNTGIDQELSYYLDQAEQKQIEMARRLQGLSAINELDRIETPKAPILVSELLQRVYTAHHADAEVYSIHLNTTQTGPDGVLPAQLEKLDLLFENLIYNALKFTEPEGTILISGEVDANQVRLSVSDTGCGIPKAELPYVFQRFFVGKQNKSSGTGLGLYIVHSIVIEMGGEITVSSQPGKGTCFLMTFPSAQPDCSNTANVPL